MKNLPAFLFILTLCAGTAPAAHAADCYKDGKAYPPGTVIEGFICKPNGNWIRN